MFHFSIQLFSYVLAVRLYLFFATFSLHGSTFFTIGVFSISCDPIDCRWINAHFLVFRFILVGLHPNIGHDNCSGCNLCQSMFWQYISLHLNFTFVRLLTWATASNHFSYFPLHEKSSLRAM